jgi:hypothetical protein
VAGSSGEVKGSGHEAKQEDNQRAERGPTARWVERSWIVNGSDTKKTNAEKQNAPDAPSPPGTKQSESDEKKRENEGRVAVETRADRTENVAPVELGGGKKIEGGGKETDPGGAADGMNQKSGGRDAGMEQGREETKQQRHAENEIGLRSVGKIWDDFCVENAIGESRNRQEKTGKGAGGADIEEGARGAYRRTNKNESAERADERRKGNKKRIGGADAMITAGKKMAELVSEKNNKQSHGEGDSRGEAGGMLVKELKGADVFIKGSRLVVGVGDGELSAGGEASAKSKKEEYAGDDEHFSRWADGNWSITRIEEGNAAPVEIDGNGAWVFWGRCGHEMFGKLEMAGTRQYNAARLFRLLSCFEALKFFAGFEAHGFAGRDVDFFAGAGIAADAGFARLDAENAEAAELDALAAAEGLLERFEHGFDGLLGFGTADVSRGDDGVYDVQLDHTSLRRIRGQMLEGGARVVKT